MSDWLRRWAEKSVGTPEYWGTRWDDVLYEKGDGLLTGLAWGACFGVLIGVAITVMFR